MDRNARGALETIVASKRGEVERLYERADELAGRAANLPPARSFETALRGPNVRLIAEFKRRSPSAGWIQQDAKISRIIPAYEAAGVAALSVLTDQEFFGGSLVDFEAARKVSTLPLLRKDFIIDELQLLETRVAMADAVLLIARILSPQKLRELQNRATELGLATLVETHDAAEVEIAISCGARVIGINNRDLSSFQTNTKTALDVLPKIPTDVIVVAESGIRGVDDVRRYGAAGFDAVLVGEWLMRQPDAQSAAASLTTCERKPRVPATVA